MNENCRHLRETHSFSPEQLAAAAVCLSDLLTIYHTHTSTTTCIIVHLSSQTNLRVLTPTPLVFLQGCCPISGKCSFGLGVLVAASGWSGFVAQGFGLVWQSVFIFLSLSLLSLSILVSFSPLFLSFSSISHTD